MFAKMSRQTLSAGLQFFGNLVELDCYMRDLRFVLKKDFPDHESAIESESLINDIFPQITRRGFVVTLIIALEDQFKIFCEILKTANDQKLKWGDLKGSTLERFLTYSEKVCGLNNFPENGLRQKLAGLIEVRNCIVHNNSCIDGFSKKQVIENLAKEVDGLSIEDGYIVLELVACTSFVDIVFEYMQAAYNSALLRYPHDR
jgi:hypothetical protein